jgi:serine phosphatase RsbU (regulator of sigma subunit)
MVAVVFIFRSYRQSKRNAKDLASKNKLIGEKNKEITDSINYAKNIQQSLLTSENVFKENTKDYFLLFMPKDIVSGDFYWAQKIGDEFLVICADCTGHGGPGAFMSLLAISNLKETTFHKKILRPDLVLNDLRKHFIDSFSLSDNKDGMDASLIKIKGKHMEMAAANNPIWIIRKGQNMVIKPNKFPIGKHHGEVTDFSLNGFELEENDLLMMFTDGYADQFGGPKNKKFKYKKMEQLIISNSHLPLAELKAIMEKEMKGWKGANEQIDDILLLGIRI